MSDVREISVELGTRSYPIWIGARFDRSNPGDGAMRFAGGTFC